MLGSKNRWLPWLVLVASLLGAAYAASGYAMAASFSVANPERQAHWRTAAPLYAAGVVVGLVAALAASVHLLRTRRGSDAARG
jgi:hypothetical protein